MLGPGGSGPRGEVLVQGGSGVCVGGGGHPSMHRGRHPCGQNS